ncbi:hypothetical protein HDZ31DRAFT_64281 [Schizophyllum fasciatum]
MKLLALVMLATAVVAVPLSSASSAGTMSIQTTNVALNHPTSPPKVSTPGGGDVKLNHPTTPPAVSTPPARRADPITYPHEGESIDLVSAFIVLEPHEADTMTRFWPSKTHSGCSHVYLSQYEIASTSYPVLLLLKNERFYVD